MAKFNNENKFILVSLYYEGEGRSENRSVLCQYADTGGPGGVGGIDDSVNCEAIQGGDGNPLYYFKNKEQLILSLFKEIKKRFQSRMFADYDPRMRVKDTLRKMWGNSLTYAVSNYEEQIFLQQFNISPYRKEKEAAAYSYRAMKPLLETLANGQQQGLIKEDKENLTLPLLFGFVNQLASFIHENPAMLTKSLVDKTFRYFWDAISR